MYQIIINYKKHETNLTESAEIKSRHKFSAPTFYFILLTKRKAPL